MTTFMLSPDDQTLVFQLIDEIEGRLALHYKPGFGITPTAHPKSNYYDQIWARDLAHAAGNYFAHVRPEAVEQSLALIFRYQRPNGMLPYRVEREYQKLKLVPGFRHLAKHAFVLVNKIKSRTERPVYEGQDAGGGEDTIPVVLIAVGEFFRSSAEGKKFAEEHFVQLQKAVDFFRAKTDPADDLAIITKNNADWADTIKRHGKLGGINIWWAECLRSMADIAEELKQIEEAKQYRKEYETVNRNILKKLYAPEGYFKAEEHDGRLDTVASIFGALYLLDAKEAARVEETLARRVLRPTGYANFDPPYHRKQIYWSHRFLFPQGEYHNHYIWPWVTLQNIYVKIKIAQEHPNDAVREKYKTEAIADIIQISKIFKTAGGAHEILHPDRPEPPRTRFYKIPQHFMGTLAGYAGIYRKMKNLGWLK
ncbi:MAG: hypothetical protein KGJ13_00075 [Patescibacteria group bacterium]|nr:hypothetical protein [Patescibacteria group bacterium]